MTVKEALLLAATAAVLVGAVWSSGRQGETHWNARVDYRRDQEIPARVVVERPDGRLVRHMFGETLVPLRPMRIVSLSTPTTDGLLALGVRPIGVEGQWKETGPIAPHAPLLGGVPLLGFSSSVNLEGVAALKPDLILCGRAGHGRIHEKLQRIAPTVFLPSDLEGRSGGLLEIGAILGMGDQAERRLTLHRERLADARRQLKESNAGTVAVLRIRFRDCMIFGQRARFGPLLYGDSGLGLTPDQRVPPMTRSRWADSIDVEALSEITADRIFLLIDPDAAVSAQDLFRTVTWQGMPAVRRGLVHRVDFGTWTNSQGVLAEEYIVREVVGASRQRAP